MYRQKYMKTSIQDGNKTYTQTDMTGRRNDIKKNRRTNILEGKERAKNTDKQKNTTYLVLKYQRKNAFCMLKMLKIRMKLSKIRT